VHQLPSIALRLALVLFSALCLGPAIGAQQCPLEWSSGGPQAALVGSGVCSTTWDPDGAGPLPQRLVVGGANLTAGSVLRPQRVMTWDGTTWDSLGNSPGASGTVRALAVWNNQLVAAGDFTGGGTDRVALWNGSSWQPLGTGFPVDVGSLAVFGADLVATGTPAAIPPVIQRWNGSVWTALPAPPTLSRVYAMVSFQGTLCVGGERILPSVGVLERWNGTTWLSSTTADSAIRCLAVRSFSLTSSLYVGGHFTSIGGVAARYIASSSGSSWLPIGAGLGDPCTVLHVRATSALGTAIVARVQQTSTSTQMWQLSGGAFVQIGFLFATSLTFYGGSYHGTSEVASVEAACSRLDSSTSAWRPVLGPGIAGRVQALTAYGDDIVLGGTFGTISGVVTNNVARWDGSAFQPLGTGVSFIVNALLTLDNGDVLAGGSFSPTGVLSRWNGSTWSPVVSGANGSVYALCRMPNGDQIVGGGFTTLNNAPCLGIARGTGNSFAPLGGGLEASVNAVAVRGDGVLFAGGAFFGASLQSFQNIAQWNGTTWQPLGTGCNAQVTALTVRPNGDVVVAGDFTTAGGLAVDRCALWTANGWAPMNAHSGDDTSVRAVLALPNGDVIAGRGFHQPTADPDQGIARWNGASWSGIGTGLQGLEAPEVVVSAIAQRRNGEIVVAGRFGIAGGLPAHGLARLTTTCAALAQPYGAGCSSTAGPLAIGADTLPWLGTTFRTTTTGVPGLSLCFCIIGFASASTPLSALHPLGQPGCSLLATVDNVTVQLPVANRVQSDLMLPLQPAFVGATLHNQTIAFELSAGVLVASNGLAATLGML
jgi:hypothetical protein